MLDSLLAIALAFFIVTVSPGPANIAVATVAMRSGRKSGILFGLGLSVGLGLWGLVAATGMGAILQSTPSTLFAMKLLGGLYLLWLAFQSARSSISTVSSAENTSKYGRWFWRGLVLNLSNPKAVVAWLAALSMGLNDGGDALLVAVATAICIALGLVNYAGHAVAFSLAGFMAGYKRFARWIDGIVAGLFAVAGLSLIRSAFSR